VQTFVENVLVDVFGLMVDPLLVGGGKRVFPADDALRKLELVDSRTTTTGAILPTYASTGG
jgi:dihydrofolate reductase